MTNLIIVIVFIVSFITFVWFLRKRQHRTNMEKIRSSIRGITYRRVLDLDTTREPDGDELYHILFLDARDIIKGMGIAPNEEILAFTLIGFADACEYRYYTNDGDTFKILRDKLKTSADNVLKSNDI